MIFTGFGSPKLDSTIPSTYLAQLRNQPELV